MPKPKHIDAVRCLGCAAASPSVRCARWTTMTARTSGIPHDPFPAQVCERIRRPHRHGEALFSAWQGKEYLPGEPGSREFMAVYQAALEQHSTSADKAHRGERKEPGTMAALIASYYGSAEYKTLAPITRSHVPERNREDQAAARDKTCRQTDAGTSRNSDAEKAEHRARLTSFCGR